MTAPVRRPHAEDLWYLAAEAKKADDPGLGSVFRHRLERAAKAADGLAREAEARSREAARLARDVAVARDENDMLRAEAADRERAVAAVQAVRAELAAFGAALADSDGEGADRVRFMLHRMRDVVDRAVPASAASEVAS